SAWPACASAWPCWAARSISKRALEKGRGFRSQSRFEQFEGREDGRNPSEVRGKDKSGRGEPEWRRFECYSLTTTRCFVREFTTCWRRRRTSKSSARLPMAP